MEITLGYVVNHPEIFGPTSTLCGVYTVPTREIILSNAITGNKISQTLCSENSIAWHIVQLEINGVKQIYFTPPEVSRQKIIVAIKNHSWKHGAQIVREVARLYDNGGIRGVALNRAIFEALPEEIKRDTCGSLLDEKGDEMRFVRMSFGSNGFDVPIVETITQYVPLYLDVASKQVATFTLLKMPRSIKVVVEGKTVKIL